MKKAIETIKILDGIIEACALIVLFCLPFSKSAVEIFVVLSIIFYLFKKIFFEKKFKLRINGASGIFLALFVAVNIISLFNSQYPDKSIPALFSKTIKWAIFFMAVAETINTEKQARRIFMTMLFSCALILTDAVYQQFVSGMDFLHYPKPYPVFKIELRATGAPTFPTASFPYPNDFATWINVYLFTFLSLCVFGFKRELPYRVITAFFCAVLAFFLFLTTTGGAMLGAFVALAVLILTNIRKLIIPVTVILFVVFVGVTFVPYLNGYLKEGILDKIVSINDRKGMWTAGWRIFIQHPIVGNGVNTFFELFKYFREDADRYARGSYAHNCILQMASDIGILGALSFLAFYFSVILRGISSALPDPGSLKKSLALGLSIGMAAFLVHSVFDTNLYSLNLAALFWFSMGAVEGLGRNR
jgi:O-antigen ligase